MTEIAIETVVARYHLPASAAAERDRLDRAMTAAFEALPLALSRHGVDPDQGEICVREIHVPVRVRLGAGDAALILGWSDAAAGAIVEAIAAGGGDAVRYASRRQALADLAAGVARADLGRAWAWVQLGLCRPDSARSAEAAGLDLARALAAEPEAIVPVLAAVARDGLLAPLAARLPDDCWPVLAARALAAAGAAAAIPQVTGGEPGRRDDDAAPDPEIERRTARALDRSALTAGARTVPGLAGRPALRRALAGLALLEADPGLLAMPAVAGAVAAAASGLVSSGPVSSGLVPRGASAPGGDELADLSESGSERRGDRGSAESRASAGAAEPASPSAADLPRRLSGRTAWGGLLFLLVPLEELGLADELAASPQLAGRPFRWNLHRLALALVPAAPDDPAALAFCGLTPDAPPPSAAEPPAAPEEEELFATLAARLAAEVAERLGEPPAAAAAVLDRVCRREAEIVADPGWFEVRLALDDASTELRRSRLDLDPGHLPWLGVVVRFVYG